MLNLDNFTALQILSRTTETQKRALQRMAEYTQQSQLAMLSYILMNHSGKAIEDAEKSLALRSQYKAEGAE